MVYGKTSAHVLAVTAVLEDGSVLEAKPVASGRAGGQALREIAKSEDTVWVLVSARDKRDEIEATFPQLTRFLTRFDLGMSTSLPRKLWI